MNIATLFLLTAYRCEQMAKAGDAKSSPGAAASTAIVADTKMKPGADGTDPAHCTNSRELVDDLTELNKKQLTAEPFTAWRQAFKYARFYRSAKVGTIMSRLFARQIPGTELHANDLFALFQKQFPAWKLYVMGGVVRDAVQGIQTPNDLDISLNIKFEELKLYCDARNPPIPCEIDGPHSFRIGTKAGPAYVEGFRNIQSATGAVEMHDFMINTLVYDVRL